MTPAQFDNGYWYATELKDFAKRIGIRSTSKLRKDEIERAVKMFLKSGKIAEPNRTRRSPTGPKDVDRGLRLDLRVVVYTNDKETKRFIERAAQELAPGLKRKSGARYRLNRWRERQIDRGVKLTYRDLVGEYVRLNQSARFERISYGRYYVYFVSDFLAAEKGATREAAIKAWKRLKTLDVPKDYRSWVRAQQ